MGFYNITVPKNTVLGSAPTVYIDSVEAGSQGYCEDEENYYVWFTTQFSTHDVEIAFTGASTNPTGIADPKVQILIVAAALAAIAIAAFVMFKRTRRANKPAPQ
jgi:hypothetical protein